MTNPRQTLTYGLLGVSLVSGARFVVSKLIEARGIAGQLYADGTPVGGDFINLWSAAKLVLVGRSAEIYRSAAFMDYEKTFTGAAIGHRVWAYPVPSLLAIWPFGLMGFYLSLAVWSVLGLAVLAYGARRFGFSWLETAIILVSPASLLSLYYGQTGNLMVGLLLVALSLRHTEPAPIISAALLTLKPQAGFLLPVLWVYQRRWWPLAITAGLVLALIALATALFGISAWRDYLGDTLVQLSLLERYGFGPFMSMIPSVFMAMRVLQVEGDTAFLIHAIFAVVIGAVLLIRLWQVTDPERRVALILIATALITPYLHNYDLTVLLCGALLVARRWPATSLGSLGVNLLVIAALMLPLAVVGLNLAGVPISPLLILPLLFLA